MLHIAATLSNQAFWQALSDCFREGLVGSLQPPDRIYMGDVVLQSAFFQRMAAFGLVTFGLLVPLFGYLVVAYRRSCGELPIAVVAGWLVLCILMVAIMPCSVLWLGVAIGLWMLWLAKAEACFDDASDGEDTKFSASPTSAFSPTVQLLSPQAAERGEIVLTPRNMTSVVVLTSAYALLVPGIVTKMFSAKAVVGASVVLDIEKSTVGLISFLFGQSMWLPALIILLYSVVMPFAKLLIFLHHLRPSCSAVPHPRLVQKISKWATVDVFTAATICVFFCQPHLYLEINLHDGFYYFLSYCVLSVAGASLMDSNEAGLLPREAVKPTAMTMLAGLVALAALVVVLLLPILKVQFQTIGLDAQISIVSLVVSLWARFPFAAISLAILLLLMPCLDVVLVVLEVLGREIPHPSASFVRRWIKEFAMLDVFALALVVVLTAVTALHNDLHLRLLPAGWLFCSLTVPGVAYSWTTNFAPTGQ